MKKFAFRLLMFLVLGFALTNLIANIFVNSHFGVQLLELNRPFETIVDSKMETNNSVAVIGGSIGNQFYSSVYKNSYCTWATVLMPGHYIITKNIVENSPNIKDVIFFAAPTTLSRGFNASLTFGSLIKPFLRFEYLSDFNSELRSYIAQKPLAFLYIFPLLKCDRIFSDIDYSDGTSFVDGDILFSDLSISYMKKLKLYLEDRNIKLHLVSPPVNKDFFYEKTQNWTQLKLQLEEEGLGELFAPYFKNMVYLNGEQFSDYGHLKPEVLRTERQKLFKKLMPANLQELLLEDDIAKPEPLNYKGPSVFFNSKEASVIEGKLRSLPSEYTIRTKLYFDPRSPSFELTDSTPYMPFMIGGWGVYEQSVNTLRIYADKLNDYKVSLQKGWYEIEIISSKTNNETTIKINDIDLDKESKNINKGKFVQLKAPYLIGKGYQNRYWTGKIASCTLINRSTNESIDLLAKKD